MYDKGYSLPKSGVVESGFLEGMLQNFSASYKLYWLKGIFAEVTGGNTVIELNRIVARMIGAAWYPVIYYNLSLGHADKLGEAIQYIYKELGVARDEQEENIVKFVCECEDKELKKKVREFTNMVPYRLIRPFYQQQIANEKSRDKQFTDSRVNALIERFNRRDDDNALYRLDKAEGILTVLDKWAAYLTQNAAVVEGWINYKLIEYVQRRNPNVPAIPFKIFSPAKRNNTGAFAAATRYWGQVQAKRPMPDLYTGNYFTNETIKEHGAMSLDHFIPWSFVLHDELWNLYPAFKNINSMKGNKLPDISSYLGQFCESQYQAFLVAKEIPEIKRRAIDQYRNVNHDIDYIGDDDRGHDAFVLSLWQTIEPLYQIARNQGYGVWRWEG